MVSNYYFDQPKRATFNPLLILIVVGFLVLAASLYPHREVAIHQVQEGIRVLSQTE